MQLSLPRSDLLHLLHRVAPAADPSRSHPYAGTVLLRADGGRLTATANTLAVLVEETAAAAIKKPGAIAVPHRRLLALASAAGGDTIHLHANAEHVLKLHTGGQRKAQLGGLDALGFPLVERSAAEQALPAGLLNLLVRRVEHAAGDTDRAFLNGVHLEADDTTLNAVAICGSRVAWASVAHARGPGSWFLPRMLLRPLLDVTGESEPDRDIKLGTSASTLTLSAGSVLLAAMLPVGSFPDWRRVIGSMPALPVGHVNSLLLSEAVKAVLAADTQADAVVDMRFDVGEKAVFLSVDDPVAGSHATDVLPFEPADGSTGGITRVQGRFLRDALHAANGRVLLSLGNLQVKNDLAVLGVASEDGYLSLVMPVAK